MYLHSYSDQHDFLNSDSFFCRLVRLLLHFYQRDFKWFFCYLWINNVEVTEQALNSFDNSWGFIWLIYGYVPCTLENNLNSSLLGILCICHCIALNVFSTCTICWRTTPDQFCYGYTLFLVLSILNMFQVLHYF